jgi:hypothetical protein
MLSPIKIGQELVVLAVVRDITEPKRAEEHLQLLTRETNHHAKNILSVVQAPRCSGKPELAGLIVLISSDAAFQGVMR